MKPPLCFLLVLVAMPLWAETAQEPLPTVTLTINAIRVVAEVADEDPERTTGLMFRDDLGQDEGMLFVMPSVGPAAFYMKNTKLPLSIAYIGAKGTILEIHDLEPFEEIPVRSRFQNIAYALEMNRGWFSKNSIFPGIRVEGLPRGPQQ